MIATPQSIMLPSQTLPVFARLLLAEVAPLTVITERPLRQYLAQREAMEYFDFKNANV